MAYRDSTNAVTVRDMNLPEQVEEVLQKIDRGLGGVDEADWLRGYISYIINFVLPENYQQGDGEEGPRGDDI